MSDTIRKVRGTPKRISLNPNQRVVIDTPAGLIEIRGVTSARLELIIPKCYRFRKGPRPEMELHLRYLQVDVELVRPAYKLLISRVVGGEIELIEPDVIPVG